MLLLVSTGLFLQLPVVLSTAFARGDDHESVTPSSGATQIVEGFHGELLSTMRQAEKLGYEGRVARLRPVIHRVFDLPFMGRKSAGRHWKTLSEAQRAKLQEAFARLSVATYAERFDGYSGESFATLAESEATHGMRMVQTRLLRQDKDDVELTYRLRPKEGSWKIIDVLLGGTVSELAMRRAQYSAMIRRKGFDQLIRALEDKIYAYARTSSP